MSEKNPFPVTEVPQNAVEFLGNQSLLEVYAPLVPILIGSEVCWVIKRRIFGAILANIAGKIIGVALIVPFLFIHEILHAAVLGVPTELFMVKVGLALIPMEATPKTRYIVSALAPFALLGCLPLAVWVFLPSKYVTASTALYFCAVCELVACTADIANAIRATIEIPRGSFVLSSGSKVYWFVKDEGNETR